MKYNLRLTVFQTEMRVRRTHNKIVRYMRKHFARVYCCAECWNYYKLDGERNLCKNCYDPKCPDEAEYACCWNQNNYYDNEPCEGSLNKDGTCKQCDKNNKLSFFTLNKVRRVFGYLEAISYNKYQHMRWIIENDTIPRIHDMKYALERRLHELHAKIPRINFKKCECGHTKREHIDGTGICRDLDCACYTFTARWPRGGSK